MSNNENKYYFISIASGTKAKGAILLEFDDTPDIIGYEVDPAGGDVEAMELGRYYSAEEMEELGYLSGPDNDGDDNE